MTAVELIKRYLKFFQERGHQLLPNLPLVPEDDPTTLFITAGMQPLTPYLLGQKHPLGPRLVSLQRCLRTPDIESVGDTYHHTFFEMLGNWSLGDYFKKEALTWSYEFVTEELGLEPARLSVTIFSGNKDAPYDSESEEVWLSLGIPRQRIYALGKEDNWWEASGSGPGGPDSEIFYDTGKISCNADCRPSCPHNCGKYFEIWNNVFMEYRKQIKNQEEYEYLPLPQKNVDTGMGVERTTAVLQGKEDNYQTELFLPILRYLVELSGKSYQGNEKTMRIITDHLRAATFALADGVAPSNLEQGYIVRRLIRRAVRFGRLLAITKPFLSDLAKIVIEEYQQRYPYLQDRQEKIEEGLGLEEEKFSQTLVRGLKEFEKMSNSASGQISGEQAFSLYETFGFPIEMTAEEARNKGLSVAVEEFKQAFKNHQEISRASLAGKFAGGLADASLETRKLHTATHLLHQALRDVLGNDVVQKGSNITAERLRFDFAYPSRLTGEQIEGVERLVNQKIAEDLPVTVETMSLREAQEKGALSFFGERYPEKVKVYSIGGYSKEVCAGPHAERTGVLGHFKIIKEEGVSAGVRRIKAILCTYHS